MPYTIQKNIDLNNFPPAIFLMGPTASGKSHIAMEIAKHLPIEIISVDSAQVYRHMDIGTAKPDQVSLNSVPHHLIDLIDPTERYSAAQFCVDARNAMHQITQRGNIPFLIGGTLLYFRALQEGLSTLPSADKELRIRIENMAKKDGWPAMHQKLETLDPITATRIKATDSQRIQRALEVCYLTEKPMSEILKQPKVTILPYQQTQISLIPSNRSILHQRIAQRFEGMLTKGLIEEVQTIRKQFNVNADMSSMRCVGYRQISLYLDNKINLSEMHAMGLAATRQLAKRQLTWIRNIQNEKPSEFDCLATNLSDQVLVFLQDRGFNMT